ncbi:MAG: hypothetical protein FJX72_20145 [Armatimonadetes bacterium]|nr:hypothetical protein [Armatimonadota bacterium]
MRIAFAALLAVHALIHLMGFSKAFGPASLAQLQTPITRPMGVLWLVATMVLLAAVGLLFAAPRWFWLVGLAGLMASQVAIVASWADARFGTIANAVLLAAVVYGAFAWGPFGLRAEYERLVREGVERGAAAASPQRITDADLAALPPLVQRYLRVAGVVGTPRVQGFRARMTGRIRGSAAAPWMPFTAEQHNFYDPPRRYFWMTATRAGLPVDGLHAYGDTDASMRVRLLSLVPVVTLGGAAMMRTETVTLLNDMSLFVPGSLLDPSIRWRELDARSVEATYTNGPHTIRAVLVFDDDGALADFWSDDRPALAEDGKTMLSQRWSTPVGDYRPMGPYRLPTRGEGRYVAPSGAYAYLQIEVQEVSTDVIPHSADRR